MHFQRSSMISSILFFLKFIITFSSLSCFSGISFLGTGSFPAYDTYSLRKARSFFYFYYRNSFFYYYYFFFLFAYSSCLAIKLSPSFYSWALLLFPEKSPFTLKNIGPSSASQYGSTVVTQLIYYREVITSS